jgi:hypothetical protein
VAKRSSQKPAAKAKSDAGALKGFHDVETPQKVGRETKAKTPMKSGYARLVGNVKPGGK